MSTTTKGNREFRDDNSIVLHDKIVHVVVFAFVVVIFTGDSNWTILLRILEGFMTVMAVVFTCLLVA